MADVTAQTSVVPPTPTGSTTGPRLSSRQYLEELRARRQAQLRTTPARSEVPVVPATPSAPPLAFTPTAPITEPTTQPAVPPSTVPEPSLPMSELFPGQIKPLAEETVYEWTAPSRPFKKRNRQFYTTIGLITLLISLILFFAGQFLPIAVVISVAFLGYVLSSVPPEQVVNKITTYGLRTDDALFYWDELGRFWFDERYGQPLVNVETNRFPGQLTLVVNENQKKQVETILSEVLLQQKPKATFIDKSAQWLQEKIPLDVT